MKKLLFFLFSLILSVGSILFVAPKEAKAQIGYNIGYNDFYNALSPYGQWIYDPQYGYVWMPNVGNDFRPYYTNGYWAMTEYGNTWVSGYDWGWAPFHYGRWIYDYYYGWLWIPDNVWGPAWVTWRQGNGYYGWAPMGPGSTVQMSFGRGYSVPMDWWVFINPMHLFDRHFYRYNNGFRNNQYIINRTTIINNTYVDRRNNHTYVSGPRVSDIERVSQQRVQVYRFNDAQRGGATRVNNGRIDIYRPNINGRRNDAAPAQVVRNDRSIGTPREVSSNNSNPVGRQQILSNTRNNNNVTNTAPVRNNNMPTQNATIDRSPAANDRTQSRLRNLQNVQNNNTAAPAQNDNRRVQPERMNQQPAVQQQSIRQQNVQQSNNNRNNIRQPQQSTAPSNTRQDFRQSTPRSAEPVRQAEPVRNMNNDMKSNKMMQQSATPVQRQNTMQNAPARTEQGQKSGNFRR